MELALPPLDTFLDALLAGDSRTCLDLAGAGVEQPADLRRVYLELFQPALYEVGRLWAMRAVSVAQEHLATAMIERLMAQFYPLLTAVPRHGGTAVLTTAPGELHQIGARMVADFLELDGWTITYLGANTPLDDLCDLVASSEPRVVGISVGIRQNLPRIAETIAAVRGAAARPPLMLVGGQAFAGVPELWRRVGADAFAPTAGQVLQALEHPAPPTLR